MKIWSLKGNSQKLDGGAMFGHAPKAMWTRWVPADDLNRIDLACRCMLIERKEKGQLILIEAGVGAFFSPKYRDRFGVQESEHILLKSLDLAGFSHEEITHIILSHLHFDHAGGLLAAYEEGKNSSLLFPNAKFILGKEHFKRAKNPHSRDKASFIPELPELLESTGRTQFVDEKNNNHDLKDFISFTFSSGHTPGLTLPWIEGSKKRIVFPSDLIPGAPWVHLPISMGYDRYPELVSDEKRAFLEKVVKEDWELFYTHDADYATSKVKFDGGKVYKAVNGCAEVIGENL